MTSDLQPLQSATQPKSPQESAQVLTDSHPDSMACALVTLGCLLRLRAAWGTFLNPDEALHFFIANQSSWASAYKASLTMAHPPLLILLLYAWRNVGTSEFVLRLPSVLAGTAFCWIFFKWLTRLFGNSVARAGLILASLLPPLVALSGEVRQYELLLLFAISAAYFLERALATGSAGLIVLSSAFTCLSMISHYSGFLFAATLGIYSFWRMVRGTARKVIIAWIAGQAAIIGLAGVLYVTHISRIKNTTMAEQALDSWLRKSYFHPGQGGALAFVIVRSFSFFQYLLGQSVVGDVAGLAFVAGIVLLLRNKLTLPNSGPTRGQLAFLLVLPFAINAIAGVLDRYPYGGTRHSIFLTIFAIPGISLCLARITQQRKMWGIVAALAIPLLGFAFPTIRHPYISRTDQDRRQMDEAIGFIRDKIPASAPLFVDYESGIILGHYLCQQKQVVYDGSIPGFLSFSCGGHHLVSTIHDLWAFTPETFFDQWNDLVRNGNFEHGTTVWVGQVGWITDLDDQLREDFPAFHDLRTTAFGSNVKFFSLMVGQPIPSNIRPGHELERQPLAHLFSQNTKAELVGSALSPLL